MDKETHAKDLLRNCEKFINCASLPSLGIIMRIHGYMLVYNAVETVEKALNSLLGKVDDIYILDNRWIGVEGKDNISDDGTIEKIVSWALKHPQTPVHYFLYSYSQLHQIEARNKLLSKIPDGDWVFILDSDEEITKWIPNLKDILEKATVKGFRICGKGMFPIPTFRLFKKANGIHYTKNHRFMDDNDGAVFTQEFPILKIQVLHQPESETKKMRPIMEKYKDWLVEWEAKHKDEWAVNKS